MPVRVKLFTKSADPSLCAGPHTTRKRKPLIQLRIGDPSGIQARPMSTLKSRLDSLVSSFASEIVRAIQSSPLEDLLADVGPAKRSPGRPPSRHIDSETPAPAPQKPKKGGRLPRRSASDIKAALDRVHGLLKSSKGGLRSEQIRVALNLDVREIPRVLKEGLASKKLTSKGQKRATTYFAK
jgi:hypothetical protein